MQKRVREIFGTIADEARQKEEWRWVTIDAGKEREAVSVDIWREIEPFVKAKELGEVKRLWEWKKD